MSNMPIWLVPEDDRAFPTGALWRQWIQPVAIYGSEIWGYFPASKWEKQINKYISKETDSLITEKLHTKLPKTIFHYCKDAHQHRIKTHQHHITSTKYYIAGHLTYRVLVIIQVRKYLWYVLPTLLFFGAWIYGILHFRNFAQRVNICYIAI